MGWEWRYFTPLRRLSRGAAQPLPARAAADFAGRQAARVDLYFPASNSAGLKLRNGTGALEVKTLQGTSAEGDLPAGKGKAERWEKRLYEDCVTTAADGVPAVVPAACAAATGRSATELFGPGGEPLPVRIEVHKDRVHTDTGEDTTVTFVAKLPGRAEPVLVERHRSISVELKDPAAIAKQLHKVEIPEGSVICGYPEMVMLVARRAMEAAGQCK
eukprot:TRINITY_DN12124_c0_g1_i3.p1 TRINITY_DN12124_c0_g1~~TRINITY_DN12124_c0_g1_i3.p1  ORF type:complete len:240 (+),score=84.15 TRINITY_DN12124_c0_g1_i3:75-722(+)